MNNQNLRLAHKKDQNLLIEMMQYKNEMSGTDVATLSHADFLTLTTAFLIKDMQGPNVVEDLSFGRKDATPDTAAKDILTKLD